MKKVAFYTLGCKMNFHETAYMEERFKKFGFKVIPFNEKADIYVINTCTVTKQADAKSRKAIRKAKRLNPESYVIVTGCYSEVYPEEVLKIKEADKVIGNIEKFKILDFLSGFDRLKVEGVLNSRKFIPLINVDYGEKTRAFVKIQQGCESFCSYCIIPKARGRMLSEEKEKVVEHINLLVEKGFKEIVLTGTHLGAYGKDLNTSLSSLLKTVLKKVKGEYRIRLSSIEPLEFTDELVEIITSSDKIAPHFHIPLQSGSGKILRLMRRNYTSEFFENLINKIVSRRDDVCIGTDVLAGFPKEEEKDFEETYRLLNDLPLGYLHVFTYSPRKGTAAYAMKETVAPFEKKKRSEALLNLSIKKSVNFRNRFIGKVLEAIPLKDGTTVLTGNYIHIKLSEAIKGGGFLKVELKEIGEKREENRGEQVF